MNKTSIKYDLGKYNQELLTLEHIRDYVQRKIDILYDIDGYDQELSTLNHIKDYIQIKIDIVVERQNLLV